jgi:hypothetical protein
MYKPSSNQNLPASRIFPSLSVQSESVIHLFLVSYWLNFWLLSVPSCGGRKTAGVALATLQSPQRKSAKVPILNVR